MPFHQAAKINISKSILLEKELLENKSCLHFIACSRNVSRERDQGLKMLRCNTNL